MQRKVSNQNSQKARPFVPDWIREFSSPGWTNVFQLVPNNKNLYPEALRPDWKTQFNDWDGRILLLAKDGCPTRVIREAVDKGESQPWRYGQQELGDEGGWRTNNRLYRFASDLPGGKLYGSATANMLYDDPGWSRSLPGIFGGPIHDFLGSVLTWVLGSMPGVKWVACLGNEAWFLTCSTIGNPAAAARFREYRDSYEPIVGTVGEKKVAAFPLYHPGARVSIDLMERGWRKFARLSSVLDNAEVNQETISPQSGSSLTPTRSRQPTPPALRNLDIRNSTPQHRHVNMATLPRRLCRVQFVIDKKSVHISPHYNSGNTWANIIAYARSKRGGTPPNLSRAAVAIPRSLLLPAGSMLRNRVGWS